MIRKEMTVGEQAFYLLVILVIIGWVFSVIYTTTHESRRNVDCDLDIWNGHATCD